MREVETARTLTYQGRKNSLNCHVSRGKALLRTVQSVHSMQKTRKQNWTTGRWQWPLNYHANFKAFWSKEQHNVCVREKNVWVQSLSLRYHSWFLYKNDSPIFFIVQLVHQQIWTSLKTNRCSNKPTKIKEEEKKETNRLWNPCHDPSIIHAYMPHNSHLIQQFIHHTSVIDI